MFSNIFCEKKKGRRIPRVRVSPASGCLVSHCDRLAEQNVLRQVKKHKDYQHSIHISGLLFKVLNIP